jgi:hypothetical protein
MNKKAQVSFNPSDFTNSAPTENFTPPNLFQRIAQGIAAVVFVLLFSPVILGISDGLLSSVCVNPTVCLFFKFIVPAFILGGTIGAVKYMWSKQ